MLETRTLVTANKLDTEKLLQILLTLSDEGWTPALLESQKVFLKLVGVLDKISVFDAKRPKRSSSARQPGDVFLKDDDLYYILLLSEERPIFDEAGRVMGIMEDKPGTEIGILSLNACDLDKKLEIFARAVEKAMNSSLEWQEIKPGTPRLDKYTSKDESQKGLSFKRAKLVADETQAAQVLSSKLARGTLLDIIKATFVRQRDIIGRNINDDVPKALDSLKQANLLDAIYLVECRKTSQGLMGLKDKKQHSSKEMASFICPACNTTLDKELLTEGYSPSSFGRDMSNGSYWMTVWITELMTKIGIPESSILWNVTEDGEEVDILVEFLEQLWIFELKDREFGSGDAYPLNYRQARYRASKTIIVTTDTASKDAKRVFAELAQAVQTGRQRNVPIYIEGLENAEGILRREISETALRYAQRRLVQIGEFSGYNFDSIFSARFGTSFEK